MSNTPRTDAETCEIYPSADPNYSGPCTWVEAHFARTLELDLLASHAKTARLEEALKDCRTSYAGYAITHSSQYPEVLASFWKEIQRMDDVARAALADSPNWLQGRLREERERAARVAEETCCAEYEGVESYGDAAAEAIRALPEE